MPQDVSVAGFDDGSTARVMNPPFTSVRQPLEEMDARACASLLDAVRGTGSAIARARIGFDIMEHSCIAPVAG